jgi:cellulose synthase/poly-beta-1,6-N-acetylglucosamine synthase-like glycosyltransferase
VNVLAAILEGFALFVLAYFLVLNGLYAILTMLAWRSVQKHLRTEQYASDDEALASPLTPPVTVILPAFNESAGIVESVRSVLALRYPEMEVVVVNDGSTDDTLAILTRAFDLVPVRKAVRTSIPSAEIIATYHSRRDPNLVVVDKRNGGKADALNCGANVARYAYICAIDADTLLEENALIRVMKPIFDDPELVVATGGIVRIANGCRIERGRVTDIALPRNRLATMQVMEYLRAFLIGRIGWSNLASLLIISGAFGVFKRSAVEAAGGWSTDTVGEDMELVCRLHREALDAGKPYRIVFVAEPVCWTEAPENLAMLSRQRRRWQRGLAETMIRHRRMIANPRYGVLGVWGMTYFALFELAGPVIESIGYLAVAAALLLGVLAFDVFLLFLTLSVGLGIVLSVAALALEELGFRRYPTGRAMARLLLYAVVENVGYRQLVAFWRMRAFIDLARGERRWGEMQRRGFETTERV